MERNSIHESATATYTAFCSSDGNIYLQIDTYGSDHREIRVMKRQTIQFSEDMLEKLRDIITEELSNKNNINVNITCQFGAC